MFTYINVTLLHRQVYLTLQAEYKKYYDTYSYHVI
jgi:hypothetical protein